MIDDSDFIFPQSLGEKKCFCWCHTNTLGTILRRFPHLKVHCVSAYQAVEDHHHWDVWREGGYKKSWAQNEIYLREPWHKSHQIRRLQFQRYIQPLFQTYEGPVHLSVMDRFSVCGSVMRTDIFQRRTCWLEEPQRVRQVGWYPQESHLRVVLPSIGTRNVWSCARDVKSKYLQMPI